ncbi:sepiapterin reductase [Condylostylus longicornis]|uniref:sepiapterin reductase n=1 Tax=Condylostylus longicornis TaxID=2530218 RepID=UPI00244DB198|nr:sepiapterin reductase [Condylostylus longicornis]XP_055386792.1 sepiapterin reductase [Condylostylus longicornis]XP_055386797.1 sepiapterin reductase [Condylostylus longicornis]
MDLSTKKTYFLITGASKGIGKCMAIECCKKFVKNSLAVLVARSASGLEKTKNEIEQNNPQIKVKVIPMDLTKANSNDYDNLLSDSVGNCFGSDNFERAIIIHNVGSLGDVTCKAKDFNDNQKWSEYFHLNVFSVAALNSQFIKKFSKCEKIIINITSKCAIEPFNSLTFYCSGKAAREMYFRCLANEEAIDSKSNILVLNYSPGPVDTDMSLEIQNKSSDDNIKEVFGNMRAKKEILTPIQTTKKFIDVLEAKKFKSGDHIDYFD